MGDGRVEHHGGWRAELLAPKPFSDTASQSGPHSIYQLYTVQVHRDRAFKPQIARLDPIIYIFF